MIDSFLKFLELGLYHIISFSSYDHILFLVVLLDHSRGAGGRDRRVRRDSAGVGGAIACAGIAGAGGVLMFFF